MAPRRAAACRGDALRAGGGGGMHGFVWGCAGRSARPVPDERREGSPPPGKSQKDGPQRPPQRRLGRRLEGVAKAVGGGYCRLQMPLALALAVRGTMAGHRLGAREGVGGGGGGLPSPFQCIPAPLPPAWARPKPQNTMEHPPPPRLCGCVDMKRGSRQHQPCPPPPGASPSSQSLGGFGYTHVPCVCFWGGGGQKGQVRIRH